MTDLAITAAQVQPGTTDASFAQGTAGATITAGQTVYLDSSSGTYKPANATTSAATAAVVGVALNGASSGQPLKIQVGGTLTLGAGAAPAVGTVYCQSTNNGGIAPAVDLATGMRTSILGVGGAANTIILKINNSQQVHP